MALYETSTPLNAVQVKTVPAAIWEAVFTPGNKATIGFYQRSNGQVETETQARFLGSVLGAVCQLETEGLRPGDRVIVLAPSSRSCLLSYLACTFLGAVPVIVPFRPVFDGRDVMNKRIAATCRLLGPLARVLVDAAVERVCQHVDGLAIHQVDFDALEVFDASRVWPIEHPNPISHFQLSSGSTGASHGIAVTHAGVIANIAGIANRVACAPGETFVGWLPLYHDMGLVAQAIMPFLTRMHARMLSTFDFLADPIAWLRVITSEGGTITSAPSSGYQLVLDRVTDADLATLDLHSWKSAGCGAEPVSVRVLQQFAKQFAPVGFQWSSFRPTYGLAEATLAVTLGGREESSRTVRVHRAELGKLSSVQIFPSEGDCAPEDMDVIGLGTELDGVSVKLVAEDGSIIEGENRCGEVVVSGTSNAMGVLIEGGEVVPFAEGEVYTGDIGFFNDGELFVVERIKDVIIRRGENYSASVLEDTMSDLLGISSDAVVVFDADVQEGDQLVATIEVDKDADHAAIAEKVQREQQRFVPPLDVLCFVKRGSLPRTTSGKKQHLSTRELYLSGALRSLMTTQLRGKKPSFEDREVDSIAEPSQQAREIFSVVARHVRRRGLDVPITGKSDFQYDLEFDSLSMLELAMSCEHELNVSISRAALAEVHTVDDLVAAVAMAKTADDETGITAQVMQIRTNAPQYYTVVDEVQPGRRLKIDGRWINDFASSCYLGLDEDARVVKAAQGMTEAWGMQLGCPRAIASPRPLVELEQRLAQVAGVDDVMLFNSVTLLHMGVLPLLAGESGVLLMDSEAHKSMSEAAALAQAKGATLVTYQHEDMDDLRERLSRTSSFTSRTIVIDGVYSMEGTAAQLSRIQELAIEFDAWVYVDDAHGFGVLGANPDVHAPYGHGGGGVLRYAGVSNERMLYVGGLTKAYSSKLGFISCPTPEFRSRFELASTMIFVQGPPTAAFAQVHAGLDINAIEGDAIRARINAMTVRFIDAAVALGYEIPTTGFPIVKVPTGALPDTIAACQIAWKHGLLITPAVFPAAPIDHGGLRFTITAANTPDQIETAIGALQEIREVTQQQASKRPEKDTVPRIRL